MRVVRVLVGIVEVKASNDLASVVRFQDEKVVNVPISAFEDTYEDKIEIIPDKKVLVWMQIVIVLWGVVIEKQEDIAKEDVQTQVHVRVSFYVVYVIVVHITYDTYEIVKEVKTLVRVVVV